MMDLMEMIRSLMNSGYMEPAILAILGILGVRNKEAIMAMIASILNLIPKPDDGVTPIPTPGPSPTPSPNPDEPKPRRYVIVDHCHGLLEIAAEEGHVDCQQKINEVQAHLLTGKGSDHVDAA